MHVVYNLSSRFLLCGDSHTPPELGCFPSLWHIRIAWYDSLKSNCIKLWGFYLFVSGFLHTKRNFSRWQQQSLSYVNFYFGSCENKVVELVPLRRRYRNNMWRSQGCRMEFANSGVLSSVVNFGYWMRCHQSSQWGNVWDKYMSKLMFLCMVGAFTPVYKEWGFFSESTVNFIF